MFGANIFLIIGAIILAGVTLVLIIGLWTGFNFWTWRRSQKRAETERRRRRFDATGKAYPPASRGLCLVCESVHPKVYHLADGMRLCPKHYAELVRSQPPGHAPSSNGAAIET